MAVRLPKNKHVFLQHNYYYSTNTKSYLRYDVWMDTDTACIHHINVSFLRCTPKWPTKEPVDNGGEKQTWNRTWQSMLNQNSKSNNTDWVNPGQQKDQGVHAACVASPRIIVIIHEQSQWICIIWVQSSVACDLITCVVFVNKGTAAWTSL